MEKYNFMKNLVQLAEKIGTSTIFSEEQVHLDAVNFQIIIV